MPKPNLNLNPNDNKSEAQASAPGPDPNLFITLTKDDLLDLIREARRDPKREAELEVEARRISIRRDQMVKLARADEQAKVARQKACRHRKPNGEETSGGQEFSDGRVRIFCLRCQKILREYWSQSVAHGMAIQAKMEKLGIDITEDDVREASQFQGEGDPSRDGHDDFQLGLPRGVHLPDLTTDIAGR